MTGHAMVKWDYKLPTQVIQVYDRPWFMPLFFLI
jgi:hypothetical protein